MTNNIQQSGFLRQSQILPNRKTGSQGLVPISPATLWRMVADGRFPKPVKLSARVTAWRAEEVHAWLQAQGK